MEREEYLQLCKDKAIKQYKFDLSGHELSRPEQAILNAISTLISDFKKNPETENLVKVAFLLSLTIHDETSLMRFIDGFN